MGYVYPPNPGSAPESVFYDIGPRNGPELIWHLGKYDITLLSLFHNYGHLHIHKPQSKQTASLYASLRSFCDETCFNEKQPSGDAN